MKKKIYLTCKSVRYLSTYDEDAFFEWIKKIPSIKKFEGAGDELYLDFARKRISQKDLGEIIALFYRYKIEMKQLQIFLNTTNKKWFKDNEIYYWHKNVWGNE
jgi:hypothetical protein